MGPRVPHRAGRLALAGLALIGLSCGRKAAPGSIDPALASCVPGNTALLAGIDVERLRAAPLYAKLPVAALLEAQSLAGATYLLLASSGQDVLAIARGEFRQAPPGATLLAANLAVSGSPDRVRAAAAQHRTGRSGAPDLGARAAPIAAGNQIWAVMRGGAAPPLSGNAANLARVVRATEWTAFTARVDAGIDLEAVGTCATAEGARQIEESVRGLISLAAVSVSREPDLAALLRSARVSREDLNVRVSLSVPAAQAARLLEISPLPR
jgi:hypothetical protein